MFCWKYRSLKTAKIEGILYLKIQTENLENIGSVKIETWQIFNSVYFSYFIYVMCASAGSAADEALNGSEQVITSAFGNQISPVISGNYIV